jgi:hypothetical protein
VYALDFDEYARGSPVHTDPADVTPIDELCSESAADVEDILSSHLASSPIVLNPESPPLHPTESSPSVVEVELSASPRKRRRTSPSPHVDFAALYTPGSSGSVSAKRRRTATAPASAQTTTGSEFTFDVSWVVLDCIRTVLMVHICSMYSVPGELRPPHEPILA